MRSPVPPLACTVRACGRPLQRSDTAWRCDHGHSFDIARRGYVNLLQPSDRKSLDAGDARQAVEARARLLAAGVGQPLFEAFLQQAEEALARQGAAAGAPAPRPVVVDLGSGSGETLTALAARRTITGIGIDLSTAAAEHAARLAPALTWVVANADRRLPLLDGSVDLVLSQQARRNPAECARVLRPGGHLLVSVPGADDLRELRAAVQGEAVERNRLEAVVAEHTGLFTPVSRASWQTCNPLDRTALLDLLSGTYRGARYSARGRLDTLDDRLEVTLAADVCLFVRND